MHIGSKMEGNMQRYRLTFVSSAFSHISSYLCNPNRPSAVSMLKRLLPSSLMSYTRWDQYNSLTAVPKQNMGSFLRSLCTTPLMSPLLAIFEAHASSVHPNSCSQTCTALGPEKLSTPQLTPETLCKHYTYPVDQQAKQHESSTSHA